jgi:putative restriction endonuclease
MGHMARCWWEHAFPGDTHWMVVEAQDDELRASMFAYLDRLTSSSEVATQDELSAFEFAGERVSLLQHMRGIRVVAGLPAALTIRTTFRADPTDLPYADAEGDDGYYRYKWRGTDPNAYDNRALRAAMEGGKPLAWFVGVAPGRFVSVHPVWLVGEEPSHQSFVLAFDALMRDEFHPVRLDHPADLAARRRYAIETVRRRLHQPVFRRRVLAAYRSSCALCNLRHENLLDAAHIKEDSEGGLPIVPNGVAMCAIHHRAFDSDVIGIRPDYVIEVRPDILSESDGPTLRFALQGVNGQELNVPELKSAHPDRALLEERFERFQAAS